MENSLNNIHMTCYRFIHLKLIYSIKNVTPTNAIKIQEAHCRVELLSPHSLSVGQGWCGAWLIPHHLHTWEGEVLPQEWGPSRSPQCPSLPWPSTRTSTFRAWHVWPQTKL